MAPLANRPKISRGFKDFSLSFKRHPITNDLLTITNEAAIQNAVINLVRTKLGDRYFQPNLGTNIEANLFELSSAELGFKLENEINQVLKNYEPRIFVQDIQVNINDNDLEIDVVITYFIVGLETVTQTANVILKPTKA